MAIKRFRMAPAAGVILPFLLTLAYLGVFLPWAFAQDDTTVPDSGPRTHTVAEGETLTSIAALYDVTVNDLQFVNHFRNDDILAVGQEIMIPGGEALPAIIVYDTQPGNSLASIASAFEVTVDDLLATNRTLNRDYMPSRGQTIAIQITSGNSEPRAVNGTAHIVQSGETLLELSARSGVPVSHLRYVNDLPYPAGIYPGQRIRIPSDEVYRDLPGEWATIEIAPEVIKQGDTVTLYIENLLEGEPEGSFAGQELYFAPYREGYVALVGLDAFTPSGQYEIQLGGSGERAWYPFEQELSVLEAGYPTQVITVTEELVDLLDPDIRTSEDAFLDSVYSVFSEEKKWEGLFQVPVTDTVVTANYGGGRSYNGGPMTIFHSGTDFSGEIGTPILAPAAGVVVYNDALRIRGNTVIIDHGLGVMTGYYHLSESFVEVGQEVSVGQPIGAGGSTGLSTGPHLHWELRINGIPVDPLPWTESIFP